MKRPAAFYWKILFLSLLFAAPGPASARPFKNQAGTVMEAGIKSVQGEKVTIMRSSDRREFTIAIDTLSAEDQEYVKSWGKSPAEGTAEKTAPADEKIKPGARFSLDFPDLKADRHGNAARVGVQVPANFDSAKPPFRVDGRRGRLQRTLDPGGG